MINSFKNYLVEEEKTLYFVWGRMNPPTAGHEKLLDFLKAKAGNNPFRIYLTQSEDKNKNPIPFVQKVKFARKGFPQYARQIMMDKKLKTIFDAMTSFYNEGFKRVVVVAGEDRVREYEITLNKYNGKKGRHGMYNFEKITVMSAGKRDPESKGVEGVSGTKLRGYAEADDFTKFSQYMPKKLSNADTKAVYNAVRKGIGLKAVKEFKNHVQLDPISETREQYISGDLFDVGDKVAIKENDMVGTIIHLGSNYVIVEANGTQYRKWLDSIELFEEKKAAKRLRKIKMYQRFQVHNRSHIIEVSRRRPNNQELHTSEHTQRSLMLRRRQHLIRKRLVTLTRKPSKVNGQKDLRTCMEMVKFTNYLDLYEGGLAAKAKKSGVSVGTLQKVYNRGVAAWKSGHRPGTTPQQWGHARVNAFIVKKKKGGLNHDKDLA